MRKLGADFWPVEYKCSLAISNTEKAKKALVYIEKYGTKEIRKKARLAHSYLV